MQLELFPTGQPIGKRPSILARLNPDERVALIRVLARLIVKTVRPETKGRSDER